MSLFSGEQCDCGMDEEECGDDFDCCYPRMNGNKKLHNGCQLKWGSECSLSQGPCCEPSCGFVSAAKGKVCQAAEECTLSSTCDGNHVTCPLPMNAKDDTPCNSNTQICRNGKCSHSICEHPYVNLGTCSISTAKFEKKNKYEMCQIACQGQATDNMCTAFKNLKINNNVNFPYDITYEMTPGSRCNNNNGYCDAFHKCRNIDAAGPLTRIKRRLSIHSITKWIYDQWYVILICGIAIAGFMAVFIRCFSIHTPSSNPKLPRAISVRKSVSQPRQTLRSMVSMAPEEASRDDSWDFFRRTRSNRRENVAEVEMTQINDNNSPLEDDVFVPVHFQQRSRRM